MENTILKAELLHQFRECPWENTIRRILQIAFRLGKKVVVFFYLKPVIGMGKNKQRQFVSEAMWINTNTQWRGLYPTHRFGRWAPCPGYRSLTLQQDELPKPWGFAKGVFTVEAWRNCVWAWLQGSGVGGSPRGMGFSGWLRGGRSCDAPAPAHAWKGARLPRSCWLRSVPQNITL